MVRPLVPFFCLILSAAADVKVGQPAPEIALDQLLPDQPVANATLAALKGKAIVVVLANSDLVDTLRVKRPPFLHSGFSDIGLFGSRAGLLSRPCLPSD